LSVIGLTGESGGQLAAYWDVYLKVPASNFVDIQEYHLPVFHLLCMLVEEAIFGEERLKTDQKRFPDKVELIIFDFDGVFTNIKFTWIKTELKASSVTVEMGLEFRC